MIAPMVIDGAITGDLFVGHVAQVLVPSLRPGQMVVMDNLSSHKRSEVEALLTEAKCELVFLPPYSPDLNPIELAFSKLKALLRAKHERTVDALWSFLGQAIDAFSPQECQNYFRHCGYQEPLQQTQTCSSERRLTVVLSALPRQANTTRCPAITSSADFSAPNYPQNINQPKA